MENKKKHIVFEQTNNNNKLYLGNIAIEPSQLPNSAADFNTTASFSGSQWKSLETTTWKYTDIPSLTDELE